jgi:hypothetical protein
MHNAILLVSAMVFIVIIYLAYKEESTDREKYSDADCSDGVTQSVATHYNYQSATGTKSHQIANDGMTSEPYGFNKFKSPTWKYSYAKTGYPLSTRISKDGMTPAPGYYAGNHNPGTGPAQIQSFDLTGIVEGNVPLII